MDELEKSAEKAIKIIQKFSFLKDEVRIINFTIHILLQKLY